MKIFLEDPFLIRPIMVTETEDAREEEVTPAVDIFEEGGYVVVKAELPGMKNEDIDV